MSGPAPGATLSERGLRTWLARTTRGMREAEAGGAILPDWLRGLAGGTLVLLREHPDLRRDLVLMAVAGFWAAVQALDPDLRRRIEGEPLACPVPSGVPEDIDVT